MSKTNIIKPIWRPVLSSYSVNLCTWYVAMSKYHYSLSKRVNTVNMSLFNTILLKMHVILSSLYVVILKWHVIMFNTNALLVKSSLIMSKI